MTIAKVGISLPYQNQTNKHMTYAKDLKVGDIINNGKNHLKVISIELLSSKSITIRADRVYPDFYAGSFFMRYSLNKKINLIK